MGKRSIDSGRKLNIKKVLIAILLFVITIVLIVAAVKGIVGFINSDKPEPVEKVNEESSQAENTKTMDEVAQSFGGNVTEKVKEDTYYVSKDNKDYTIYLDGEVAEDKIIPWNGETAKPAIDEAGNINIYSAAELAWVAEQVCTGEKNFSGVTITLRKNIDLGARKKEDGTWEGTTWNAIIGFLDELPNKEIQNKVEENTQTDLDADVKQENLKRFDGIFNGNGCSIRGLKIDTDKRYQGLFGYSSGSITNLTIKKSYIKGGTGTGGIVGLNEGNIISCSIEDTEIISSEKVGGIVGIAMTESVLEDCHVSDTTTIQANNYVGGISGYTNNNVEIKNCQNSAKIKGNEYAGGITGIAFYGTTITECYNNSEKIEGTNYIGGIVGHSAAQLEKCANQTSKENIGTVEGKGYVGGLVGLNYIMGNISYSYNAGKVIVSEDNAGGIVGLNNSTVSSCYNIGEVDCQNATGLKIGGICGQNLSDSFIYTSYNAGKINNTNYAGGLVGADFGEITGSCCLSTCLEKQTADTEYHKTEEEMKSIVLQELGDSFKKDENGINKGFPVLEWQ